MLIRLSPCCRRCVRDISDPRTAAVRVGEAAAAHYGGSWNAELAFEFGLARVVDGIEAFVGG
jgi:hypothetical protein